MRNNFREVRTLVFPLILQNILFLAYQFIDTAMLSNHSILTVAAISINVAPIWCLDAIISLLVVGCSVFMSVLIGKQDQLAIRKLTSVSLLLSLLLGGFLTILLLITSPKIPVLMGAEKDILGNAQAYIRIISLGLIPRVISLVFSALLVASGASKISLVSNVCGNVLNILLNFFLIYPKREILFGRFSFTMWGAGLGVAGAAYATAMSFLFMSMFYVLYILVSKKSKLSFSFSVKDFMTLKISEIFKVGLPAMFEQLLRVSGQLFFFRVVATFGTIAIAANQLALTVESLSFSLGMAFEKATMTLVGISLGAEDKKGAKEYLRINLVCSVIIMSIMAVLFLAFPRNILSIFTHDVEVIHTSADLVRIVAFTQPFFAVYLVLGGALRGAGDTRWLLIISLASKVFVRIFMTIIFYMLGFGLRGAWLAMLVDQVVHALLLIWRYKKNNLELQVKTD